MVRVVKEQAEPVRPRTVEADSADDLAVVPFVDEDEVGAFENRLDIDRRRVIERAAELRKRLLALAQRAIAMCLDEVLPAPAAGRLEDPEVVAAREQLPRDSAQEVRVAVVP